MEEKKKTNKGFIAVIIILVLLLVGSIGFIVYDKVLATDSVSSEKSDVKNDNKSDVKDLKEKELDINSRLVQSLYNKVNSINVDKSYSKYWMYYDVLDNTSFNSTKGEMTKDFEVSNSSESVKMQFVGMNLNESKKLYIECSSSIPDDSGYGYSECNKQRYPNAYNTYGYSKEYVESVYKDLFGESAKLDTSAAIRLDLYGGETYVYIESLNQYVKYKADVGGTTGPGGFTSQLSKAVKNDKEVKLYEKVKLEYYGGNSQSDTPVYNEATYVYTFSIDSDGMYSFVSRLKEK